MPLETNSINTPFPKVSPRRNLFPGPTFKRARLQLVCPCSQTGSGSITITTTDFVLVNTAQFLNIISYVQIKIE